MAGRREFVQFAVKQKLSLRQACRLVRVSRRRLNYVSRKPARDKAVVVRLLDLAARHPSYGVRMLWAKLRQEGLVINRKRVRRLCREHGLLLKQKRRKRRRGTGVGVPCRAEYPNHVWAYDFLEDRTEGGRKLRILTVQDEFTRRCMEIEVEYRMNAKQVGQVLMRLFAQHGTPKFIRSDNGPEFIAKGLMQVLQSQSVRPYHIEPASPWQNGLDERFNGTYRTDCANRHTFQNRDHARVLSQAFKAEYNEHRPHSRLGYKTPMEFARAWKQERGKKKHKDGEYAGGGGLDLSHTALPTVMGNRKG